MRGVRSPGTIKVVLPIIIYLVGTRSNLADLFGFIERFFGVTCPEETNTDNYELREGPFKTIVFFFLIGFLLVKSMYIVDCLFGVLLTSFLGPGTAPPILDFVSSTIYNIGLGFNSFSVRFLFMGLTANFFSRLMLLIIGCLLNLGVADYVSAWYSLIFLCSLKPLDGLVNILLLRMLLFKESMVLFGVVTA